jgi:cytidyltransferase-like protein
MVFGVFDGLHEGHKYFLREAAGKCKTLTVVVARDNAVLHLKNKKPQHSLHERIQAIKEFDPSLTVVAGDEMEGVWNILKEYAPKQVFLGYDQQGIGAVLEKRGIPCVFLSHS